MKRLTLTIIGACVVLSACSNDGPKLTDKTVIESTSTNPVPSALNNVKFKELLQERQAKLAKARKSSLGETLEPSTIMGRNDAYGEIHFEKMSAESDYVLAYTVIHEGRAVTNYATIESIDYDKRKLSLQLSSDPVVTGSLTFSDDLNHGSLVVPSWVDSPQDFTYYPKAEQYPRKSPNKSWELPTTFDGSNIGNIVSKVVEFLEIDQSDLLSAKVVDDVLLLKVNYWVNTNDQATFDLNVFANGNVEPKGGYIIGNWFFHQKYNTYGLYDMIGSTLADSKLSQNINWKAYQIDPSQDRVGPDDLTKIATNDGMFKLDAKNNTFDSNGKSLGDLDKLCNGMADGCFGANQGWDWASTLHYLH